MLYIYICTYVNHMEQNNTKDKNNDTCAIILNLSHVFR